MKSYNNYLQTLGNSARNSYQIRTRSYSLTNQIPNSPQMCTRNRGISFYGHQMELNSRRNSFMVEDPRPSLRTNSFRIDSYHSPKDQTSFSFRNSPNPIILSKNKYNTLKDHNYSYSRNREVQKKNIQKENVFTRKDNRENIPRYNSPTNKKVMIHNHGTMQNIKTIENGRLSNPKTSKENFLLNKLRQNFVMITESRMTESISLK